MLQGKKSTIGYFLYIIRSFLLSLSGPFIETEKYLNRIVRINFLTAHGNMLKEEKWKSHVQKSQILLGASRKEFMRRI